MPVNAEIYRRAAQFLPGRVDKLLYHTKLTPNWIHESGRFWYLQRSRRGSTFMVVDAEVQRPAFDHVQLAAALSRASGHACEPYALPFMEIDYDDTLESIAFDAHEKRWRYDLNTDEISEVDKKPDDKEARISPDGRCMAFTRDHNLYIRDLNVEVAEDEEPNDTALTTDGEKDYAYAAYMDEMSLIVSFMGMPMKPVLVWSPDSSKIFTIRLDQRQVEQSVITRHVPPDGSIRPQPIMYRYPLPGDEHVAMAEYIIIDVESGEITPLDTPPEPYQFYYPDGCKFAKWTDDSQQLFFLKEERGFQKASLWAADVKTGKTRQILEEQSKTFIQVTWNLYGAPNIPIIDNGKEVVWFSQRDGWAHLYLYDGEKGELKRQITSGAWVVREILGAYDRWVYFTAGGTDPDDDPYVQQLFRAHLDSDALEQLSPGEFDHAVQMSPDGSLIIDGMSRVNLAPKFVLRGNDGSEIRILEEGDVSELQALGWRFPEPFSFKATDGVTDLYGAIYFPTDFDPEKSYPIVEMNYPGPQVIRTPKSFAGLNISDGWYWEPQAYAELGFITVTVDGFGVPFRSKAFHDRGYGTQDDPGTIGEHVAGIRAAARTRPYMDTSRVGIFGHSGGGNAAARSILSHPDFYKVAVASAGNHTQKGFAAAWGERYIGRLNEDTQEKYDREDNASVAANLQGKLLIINGEIDYGVHPGMALRLIDALIKANKDFDMLIVPNELHGVFMNPYVVRRIWDYFVRHLLNQEPPADVRIETL